MELGNVDRQITAGELLDWIDERIAILKARNPHMRIYAVRDIDDAELRKLAAFQDELTEITPCACNDLTPWSSVETLSRDGETPFDDACNMTSTLKHAEETLRRKAVAACG